MCDQTLVGGLLLAAELALIVASTMLALAIYDTKSVLTAFLSIGKSLTTATFVGAALISLGFAAAALSSGCLSGPCGSQGSAVLTALNVTIGMVTGVLASILVCAFFPAAVAVAGPAVLITLLGAGGSFAYIGAMVSVLTTCLATVGTVSPVLAIAGGFAFVTAIVVVMLAIYGIVQTIVTESAAAAG